MPDEDDLGPYMGQVPIELRRAMLNGAANTTQANLAYLVAPPQIVLASGALGLSQLVSAFAAGFPLAVSLAAGFDGQTKWLINPLGGAVVFTPAGGFTTGETTLTLSTPMDYAILFYAGFVSKWGVFVTNGILA